MICAGFLDATAKLSFSHVMIYFYIFENLKRSIPPNSRDQSFFINKANDDTSPNRLLQIVDTLRIRL